MNPRTLRVVAVAVSSLLLIAGLVRAAGPDFRKREDAAFQEAMKKRKALGLDDAKKADALRQQYPTPEVVLTGAAASDGAAIAKACPGETAKVFIGGKFQPGTSFIVESDAVKVLNEKVTPKGWQASIALPKNMIPDDIYVQIAAPVSFTTVKVRAVAIVCKMHLKLKLDDASSLEASLAPGEDGNFHGAGTWKPGAKVDLTARVTGAVFNLNQDQGQDEQMAGMNKMQAAMESPKMKALEKRQQAVTKKMEACQTKPPSQMAKCMDGAAKDLDAISAERQALMNASTAPASGCRALTLEVHGGKVTGKCSECADGKEHSVTGTFASP